VSRENKIDLFDPRTILDWINVDPNNTKHCTGARNTLSKHLSRYDVVSERNEKLIQNQNVFDPRSEPTTLEGRIERLNEEVSCNAEFCSNVTQKYASCMVLVTCEQELKKVFSEDQVKNLLRSSNLQQEYKTCIFESMYVAQEFAMECVRLRWIKESQVHALVNSIQMLRGWYESVHESKYQQYLVKNIFLFRVSSVLVQVLSEKFEKKSIGQWIQEPNCISFLCNVSRHYTKLDQSGKVELCQQFKVNCTEAVPKYLFDGDMEILRSKRVDQVWIDLFTHKQPYIEVDVKKWLNESKCNAILEALTNRQIAAKRASGSWN